MNKKIVFILVIVIAVLAFAIFNPYSISAVGPKQYKIIVSKSQVEFEQAVTSALNDGWSLVGGVNYDGDNNRLLQALSK